LTPVLKELTSAGLRVEMTLANEELSGDSSTAGVGTTLWRSCRGDDVDPARTFCASSRVVFRPAAGTTVPFFFESYGRFFLDNIIIF